MTRNPQPIPLTKHLRNLRAKLSDAEWTGDETRAASLRIQIEQAEAAMKRGELYEVPW